MSSEPPNLRFGCCCMACLEIAPEINRPPDVSSSKEWCKRYKQFVFVYDICDTPDFGLGGLR